MASINSVALGFSYILLLFGVMGASQHKFDFFYLVLQWPGSYCDLSAKCCYPKTGKPASNFSIHGLWPNDDNGSYPSNCDPHDPFSASQVHDLIPQMEKEWGSLACPSSNSTEFWSHEWSKHGTCSGLGQRKYFHHTLALANSIDFVSALSQAGIHANGNPYNSTDVLLALGSALNGDLPGLECNTDGHGNLQIYQVYICVDKSRIQIIPCPIFPAPTCPKFLHFPSF